MSKDEIIRRLLNLADHSIYISGVEPYIMSLDDGIALHEAVELLKEPISECVEEVEDRKEPVRCKDCRYRCGNTRCALHDLYPEDDWFCADGLKSFYKRRIL